MSIISNITLFFNDMNANKIMFLASIACVFIIAILASISIYLEEYCKCEDQTQFDIQENTSIQLIPMPNGLFLTLPKEKIIKICKKCKREI